MAELNFDKVLASLRLRLDEVTSENEFDEISKEFLGKDSLLSDERKKLSTLSKDDKKSYGEKLNRVNKSITDNITKSKIDFIDKKFSNLENSENEDVTINWVKNKALIGTSSLKSWMKLLIYFHL